MSYENKKTQIKVGVIFKIIAVVASIYGMFATSDGIMSLTFFTNLSNIWIDIILIIFAVLDIIFLYTKGERNLKNNTMYIIKFMLTISITLTFLIYLCILAPTSPNGPIGAYLSGNCGSLCVHFITPVIAVLDFFVFDYQYKSNKIHAVYAVIPPLAYVLFIVILGQCGVRWFGNMMAPYNFINYGAKTGWFGFDLSQFSQNSLGIGVAYMIVGLVIIFIGIGSLYLAIKNMVQKRQMSLKA